MLELLAERRFPAPRSCRSLQSARPGASARRPRRAGASEESIRDSTSHSFSAGGFDLGEWAPRFAAAGAAVIDTLALADERRSPARRQRGQPAGPRQPPRDHRQPELLDNADPVVALKPILDAAGIERLVSAPTRRSSGTGKAAVDELLDQSHALLHESDIPEPHTYAHQIAFNASRSRQLRRGRRPHRRGAQADQRDAQDSRRPVDPRQRDVRARARRERALRGRERPDAPRPRARTTPASCSSRARRDRARRPAAALYPMAIHAAETTRCSSGGSAETPATSTRSTCGSSRTTCARAPRRTPSSSPSCCTSAAPSAPTAPLSPPESVPAAQLLPAGGVAADRAKWSVDDLLGGAAHARQVPARAVGRAQRPGVPRPSSRRARRDPHHAG